MISSPWSEQVSPDNVLTLTLSTLSPSLRGSCLPLSLLITEPLPAPDAAPRVRTNCSTVRHYPGSFQLLPAFVTDLSSHPKIMPHYVTPSKIYPVRFYHKLFIIFYGKDFLSRLKKPFYIFILVSMMHFCFNLRIIFQVEYNKVILFSPKVHS